MEKIAVIEIGASIQEDIIARLISDFQATIVTIKGSNKRNAKINQMKKKNNLVIKIIILDEVKKHQK